MLSLAKVALSVALVSLVSAGEPSDPQNPPPSPTAAAAVKAPKPAPVTSLDITVSDPTGKPIEGAFVLAVPVTGAYLPFGGLAADKIRSTVTGREGKARLESLPPAPWNVTVKARGFVPQPLRRIASGPLVVRLEKGGVITGVVLGAEGKRPVAGARVAIDGGLSLPDAWQNEATRVEATTDARGRFTLEGIGRNPVWISARAPGFGRAERTDVRAGARLELFLFRGATLSGMVRDEAGQAVKGAVVRAEGVGSWTNTPLIERTDARGSFVLAGIRPGEYVVVAREGGRAPGISSVVVEPEAEAEAQLVLSDGGFVTGRVVDGEGRPLGGRLRVEVVGERGLPAFAIELMTAEAKTDGRFVLGPLPLGTLGIGVSAPQHAPRRVPATIPARGRAVDLGDVVLETGFAIGGRVRDRDGNGVAGAAVRAFGQSEQSRGESTSEDDGAFRLAGLKAGLYEVTAAKEGFASARATAQAGGDPVELVMEVGGEIAGRVVDAQGQPAEDATIGAERADETELSGLRRSSGRAEEGDGRFVLRGVPAGTYAVQARATGRGEAWVTGVRVVAGRTTNAGTITLGGGGIVLGTVADTDGQGIPGATVSAERETNVRRGPLQTQTDSAGGFEIRGVPAGKVKVQAFHPSFASAKGVVAEVDPEKEPVPVRIVLVRGGRIEGRALHRDGSPFAGGRVRVLSRESGVAIGGEPMAISPDGSFVIDHLAPGRTTFNLMALTTSSPFASSGAGVTILTEVASREVDVRDGETSRVDLSLRDVIVAGRVTRGGQPAPGVRVSLIGAAGGSMMTFMGQSAYVAAAGGGGPPPLAATTRDDGSYELLVFTPGRAFVDLASAAGNQRYPGRAVTVPDAERFELDLEVADSSVSGIVVDSESGQPLPDANVDLTAMGLEEGTWKGGADVGPDGRFSIAAEPGEYRLGAQARNRKRASITVSVGPGGLSGVRVEMERGLEITGRVVDTAGRPASGLLLLLADAQGRSGGYANSLADGAFKIGGLEAQPYTLTTGSDLAGWAFRTGLIPGDEPVTLTLHPGGHIAVRVLGPDDQPVKDAYPRIQAVGGQRVQMPGRVSGPTDSNGAYELSAPAGVVDVEVRKDALFWRGAVTVRAGETIPLLLRLQPPPPSKKS